MPSQVVAIGFFIPVVTIGTLRPLCRVKNPNFRVFFPNLREQLTYRRLQVAEYHDLMTTKANQGTKFEAKVPTPMYDAIQEWMSLHDVTSNREAMKAMIRVLLTAPLPIQAAALSDPAWGALDLEQIKQAWRDLLQSPVSSGDFGEQAVRETEIEEPAVRDVGRRAGGKSGRKAAGG